MVKLGRALSALFILTLVAPAHAAGASPPPPPETTMQAGLLMEMESGNVLWARDEAGLRSPASLTKVITALVVMETVGLDEPAVISNAARTVAGGRMFAEEGWTMSVESMLWGLLLQSGNDAAIALAEKASPDGTIEGFMDIANRRAAELGATDSNFVNPHGLDAPGHQSTARDLALITSAALQNPTFANMVASKTHIVPWGDRPQHMFINHNKLLWRYPGTIGVKTGFTNEAGNCLISAVHRDGKTLIAVVMGTPQHYAESTALYEWGFANLNALKAQSTYSIRPDLSPQALELTIASDPALAAGALTGGVQLQILIPALGIVCLIAMGIVRRYSLYFRT